MKGRRKATMKQRLTKLLSLGLAVSMLPLPVQASDLAQISTPTTQNVDVTADISSTWLVTIPKAVRLASESTGSGTYQATVLVTVEGDIGLSEKITVDTEDSLTLKDQSSNEVTATVTKDNTEFSYETLKNNQVAEATHAIQVELPTGSWSGILPFTINLTDTADNEGDHTHSYENGRCECGELDPTHEYTYVDGDRCECGELDPDHEHNYVDGECSCGEQESQEEHTHSYENGRCECGELDPTHEHNFVNHICTICTAQEAGLYNVTGALLADWENAGIDIEKDFSALDTKDNYYQTNVTSGYYVLTNGYPTATKVVIPEGVTSIGDFAFRDCKNLSEVIISDSVTNIGYYAFYDCTNLTDVEIPDSVTSIEGRAFYNTPWLASQQVEDSMLIVNNILIDGTSSSGSVRIPDYVTYIGDFAFEDCTDLTGIIIPEDVTYIGISTFDGCTNLTSITIPQNVTAIRNYAFYYCKNLTSIEIPESVTSIGIAAFSGCTGLTSIEIPESVTSINSGAFSGCTNLTSITWDGTIYTNKAIFNQALKDAGIATYDVWRN